MPAADRPTFRARHWPYDPALRFEATLEPEPAPPAGALAGLSLELPNSGADTLAFRRIGSLAIPFPAGERRLSLFWMEGYAGGLFLPFRDATNGAETYGAGRYVLDAAKSADLGGDPDRGTVIVDFNFAYQPSCAFDPRWACPLAPPENRLDIPSPRASGSRSRTPGTSDFGVRAACLSPGGRQTAAARQFLPRYLPGWSYARDQPRPEPGEPKITLNQVEVGPRIRLVPAGSSRNTTRTTDPQERARSGGQFEAQITATGRRPSRE